MVRFDLSFPGHTHPAGQKTHNQLTNQTTNQPTNQPTNQLVTGLQSTPSVTSNEGNTLTIIWQLILFIH